jgi:uncharacterized membrane protein
MKPHPVNYNFDKKRLEMFIDAIVAIIMTILVLELRVPDSEHFEGANTRELVAKVIPSLMSYIGSFLLIVGVWIDYHLLFLNLEKVTKRYILMNMFFIFWLSLIPATTAFAGTHYRDSFAVALLFVNYVLMNVFFGNLYYYANKKKIIARQFIQENKSTSRYSFIGICGLVAAIPLAYVNTLISFAIGFIVFGGHLYKKR